MSLLAADDKTVQEETWELVQMLATNIDFYRKVLKLDIARGGDSDDVDWTKFFDRSHSYRLIYTLQIVQAVLEDDETLANSRASVLNAAAFPSSKAAQSKAPSYLGV